MMHGRFQIMLKNLSRWIIVVTFLQCLGFERIFAENYSEKLELIQQKDETLLVAFSFMIDVDDASLKIARAGHYEFYPHEIGEIINESSLQRLHLTITHGHWTVENWGSSEYRAPEGLEFWSSFPKQNYYVKTPGPYGKLIEHDPCKILINGLSSFISPGISQEKVSLPWTRRFSKWQVSVPEYISKIRDNNIKPDLITRHVHIPRYVLCKENIYNVLKLLPCKNKAGIASLISSAEIFEKARYISLGIDVGHYHEKENVGEEKLSILITLVIVFDNKTIKNNAISNNKSLWTLNNIFSNKIRLECSLSDSSIIKLYGSRDEENSGILGKYNKLEKHTSGRFCATYTLDRIINSYDVGLEIFNPPDFNNFPSLNTSNIKVERHITGILGRNSTIIANIFNTSSQDLKSATYLHSFPWFVRPLLHTFEISPIREGQILNKEDVLLSTRYTPAQNEESMNVLELDIELPPKTTIKLKFEYTFIFRKHFTYYADIDRLVDLGQSILTVYDDHPSNGATQINRLFFNPLSIRIPTTDFSMPFNVVLAVSLCYTVCFCSVVSMSIRTYKISKPETILNPPSSMDSDK